MNKSLLFLILTCLFSTYTYTQSIPDDEITPICDGQSISMGAPGNSGINNITIYCNEFQPLSPFLDFYYIRIMSGTTFTFLVEPVGNDDYDFGAWLNPDLNNLGNTPDANVRGSQNDPNATGVFHLGLSLTATDECETGGSSGNPEPGVVRYFDVQPGDEILIAIDRWSQTSQGYTISFGGDAELDCTIVGNSYGKCDIDGNNQESFVAADFLPDLIASFPGSQFEFYEDQDNAESGTGPQVTFPHTVNSIDNPSELFARVETATGDFQRVVQIFLYVNELPQITSPVDLPAICDSDGNDLEEFDLTQAESDLVTDPSLYTFKYYVLEADAIAGGTNNIVPANAYESGTATIYVRVESGPLDGNEEGCFSVGAINLTLTNLLESEFNLIDAYCLNATATALPNVSDNGITGTWFPATIDTSAVGLTTYTFTPNPGQCASEFQIEIEITDQILPEFTIINSFCINTPPPALPLTSDNGISGTWSPAVIDTSNVGVTTYIFTPDAGMCSTEFQLEIEITQGVLPEFNLNDTYCVDTVADILPLTSDNGITGTWNPATIDTSLPGSTVYTFTPDVAECLIEYEIEIEIIAGATLNQINDIELCDENFDGLYEYDLTDLNNELITPNTGLDFSYYANQQDLDDDIEIPQNQWNNYSITSLPTTIIVVATNAEGCRSEQVEVTFIAGQEVQHNAGPFGPIEFCENETLDLTQLEVDIALEAGISFVYYETLSDAQIESNPITTENTYAASGNGSVFIRLEKTGRCSAILEIEYEQNVAPSIDGLPAGLNLCQGDNIDVEVSSDDPNAIFVWTWGDGQTYAGAVITISEIGTYTLTVTSPDGCERTEQLIVQGMPQPTITSVESGTDYIIVFAEEGGSGVLEYSLNGVIWQTNPRFDNLIKGEVYTVYVREDGCLIDSHQVVILDISNFVSPNGDGYNDMWEVRGIQITPNATIKIFDRYGKIFVDTNFDGNYIWDGKYMGRNIPSGDYWYIMEVPSDGVVPAQKFVGNISIRNQ